MPEGTRSSDSSPSSLRVVVVDDNPDVADGIKLLLERGGHTAEAAYDGRSALKLIEEIRPQVVLVDIGMPNMNGYEVARTICRLPERQGMRLIAMTGWDHLDDKNRAVQAGFDVHMTKPIEPEALTRVLSESLA